MGSRFSVANNAVTVHGSNLDAVVSELNVQSRRFEQAVEQLPSSWRGRSFQSWDEITTQWKQVAADLNAALTEIRSGVGQAGRFYTSGEDSQAADVAAAGRSMSWDAAKFR